MATAIRSLSSVLKPVSDLTVASSCLGQMAGSWVWMICCSIASCSLPLRSVGVGALVFRALSTTTENAKLVKVLASGPAVAPCNSSANWSR